jgi:hypothetical protein
MVVSLMKKYFDSETTILSTIVIKPDLKVDLTKESSPGSHWLTRVNPKK